VKENPHFARRGVARPHPISIPFLPWRLRRAILAGSARNFSVTPTAKYAALISAKNIEIFKVRATLAIAASLESTFGTDGMPAGIDHDRVTPDALALAKFAVRIDAASA
jgi:hypothetical protein